MTIDQWNTVDRLQSKRDRRGCAHGVFALAVMMLLGGTGLARADKIKNGTAVFSGLDKITGRIISFQSAMGETIQFGSLKVTARVCYTRPETETPQTDTFVEVYEVSAGNEDKRIFSGWMYASSPGLHGIEHPIYDIWLTDCKKPGETIVEAPQTADAEDPNAVAAAATPGAVPAGGDLPAKTPPKPKRIPRPVQAPAVEAERREPTQRFFPTSQFPNDVAVHDLTGSHNR